MSHTYASIDEFRQYLVDGGANYGATNDVAMLGILEAASRRVEGYAGRSPAGQSGFGPRTGTNKYDAQGWYGAVQFYQDNIVFPLNDDLISASTVTFLDQTGGNATTVTEGTDFYLQPYNTTPKRTLVITGLGATYIVPGLQIVSVAGTWGYAQELAAGTATLGTISSSATTAVITGGGVSLGNTIRVDNEDLYVYATTAGTALATTGGTVTVARGQNGTTAALHAAGAAISVHRYPREVVSATIQVAQRRWKMRDAGLTGDFGGSGIPTATFRDTEQAILAAAIQHLRIRAIG